MLKGAVSLFSRKKPPRPFEDHYTDWFNTLKNTHLPLLRRSFSSSSSSSILPSHVDSLLHHFLSYYDSLDRAASTDISQILFPSWRNSLEIPFLFLGDLHPYLFTHLLRSFLEDESDDSDEIDDMGSHRIGQCCNLTDNPWKVVMAWKEPSEELMTRIEQIERTLRLMVPELVNRVRKVQMVFARRVAEDWVRCEGRTGEAKTAVGEAAKEEMEDMVSVFLDANRLRRSVITEIVGFTSVYQGALFLERLAQFLVGFREPELIREFEGCRFHTNRESHLGF